MTMWNRERAILLVKKEGRTREWLAEQCGVSRNTFSHYFHGRRSPSKAVLKLLAQALNTTVEYLTDTGSGDLAHAPVISKSEENAK